MAKKMLVAGGLFPPPTSFASSTGACYTSRAKVNRYSSLATLNGACYNRRAMTNRFEQKQNSRAKTLPPPTKTIVAKQPGSHPPTQTSTTTPRSG